MGRKENGSSQAARQLTARRQQALHVELGRSLQVASPAVDRGLDGLNMPIGIGMPGQQRGIHLKVAEATKKGPDIVDYPGPGIQALNQCC